MAVGKAAGAVTAQQHEPALGGLPSRRGGRSVPRRRIQCMDDPEILARVLEGLLNLT